MFLDLPHLTVAVDDRRRTLLADAENFRLARLARGHRRPRARHPEDDIGATVGIRHNLDADCRYAVPR